VLGAGHWEDLVAPFVAAGFVAMIPSLRGENGQPGFYSGFYDENADVLAALDALAADPRVDRDRLFVAGHSMGGTQALLAALSTPKLRAAVAFSGAPDAQRFFRRFPDMLRFDPKNQLEYEMRSAVCFATSFKCPVRLWHGTEEPRAVEPARLTTERARAAGLDVATAAIPGAHSSALPGEIARAIALFSGHGQAG
jgi:dipeptidyl aminopeptidase/acylaminoacyl peptidase